MPPLQPHGSAQQYKTGSALAVDTCLTFQIQHQISTHLNGHEKSPANQNRLVLQAALQPGTLQKTVVVVSLPKAYHAVACLSANASAAAAAAVICPFSFYSTAVPLP
jgi:hypothetical protein